MSSYKAEISNTLVKRLNNDLYQLEERYFNDLYRILFDIIDGFESLSLEQYKWAIFDIRLLKKGNYELLARDLYKPRTVKEYYKNKTQLDIIMFNITS